MPRRQGRNKPNRGGSGSPGVKPSWRWELAPAASKDLHKLPHDVQQRIYGSLDRLVAGDRSLDNRKLVDRDGWRLRSGDYRVLYTIDTAQHTFIVFKVSNRKDSY